MKEELKNIDPKKLAKLEKTMDLLAPVPALADIEGPSWADNGKIHEVKFVDEYLSMHPMRCIEGLLYDIDGMVDESRLKYEIYSLIKLYAQKDLAKTVIRLIEAIRIQAYSEEPEVDDQHVHFSNGTLTISDEAFTAEKVFTRNRLMVPYNPDAPIPEIWFEYLDDMLYTEDIPALQEFLGYSMIPTNQGQVMMMIIGRGGEGKSQLKSVLETMLGDNMKVYDVQKLATDKYGPATLQGKLLMVDDELNTGALSETNVLKSIVTMKGKTYLEKKHVQTYQGILYARILALGNGNLSALHDRSDGFFRRQLILRTKPIRKDRVTDTGIINKLNAEIEGIAMWCLSGLFRLVDNGFHFTVSERMKQNAAEIRQEENNIISFYESSGYIRFEKGTQALSKDLYKAYQKWCEDNLEKPLSQKTFSSQLKNDAERLGIRYDKNLAAPGGKKARGFHGVNVLINPQFFGGF